MWAGYLALVNQQAVLNGATKGIGFINPSLYTIGMGSSHGSNFHDITSGGNGYSATTGYDLATGWGSPNGSGLITSLAGPPSTTPAFSISASPGAVSVVQGNSGSSTITTGALNGFSSAVAAPGSGSSVATFTVASSTATGTYPITVTGTGGGLTETTTVSLTVTSPATPAFTISVSPTAGYLALGQSGYAVVTTTVSGGFNSAVALSATGVLSGVTSTFSPASIVAPGAGTSHFTLTVSRTARTGTYPITISGKAGDVTHTTTLTFTILR